MALDDFREDTPSASEAERLRLRIAELERSNAESARTLAALRAQRDVAFSLRGAGDLAHALRGALQALLEIEGLDGGGIYLVHPQSGEVDLACHEGLPEGFAEAGRHYDSDSPHARIVAEGKPIYRQAPHLPALLDDLQRQLHFGAVAIVPVLHEGRPIACLNFLSHGDEGIPENARYALEAAASQIGGLILQKRAEDAHRESERRFRELAEFLPQTLFETDLAGRVTYSNRAGYEWSGYTRQDIARGLSVFDLVAPGDLARARDAFVSLIRGQAAEPREYRLRSKSGASVDMLVYSTCLERDGQPAGVCGIAADITPLSLARDALRAGRASFHAIVEQMDAGAIVVDRQGCGRYANAAAGRLLSRSADSLIGQPFPHPLVSGNTSEVVMSLPGGLSRIVEMRVLDTAWEGQDAFLVLLHDVTPRRGAEAALSKMVSLLSATMESSPDGLLVTDLGGARSLHNNRFQEIWRLTDEEMKAGGELGALGPVAERLKNPEAFRAEARESFRCPESEIDNLLELKDGRILEQTSQPQRIGGEIAGRIWRFRDITQSRRAEADLRILATAIDQAAEHIVITDPAGTIRYVNPAFEAATGYSPAEAIGQNPRILKSGRHDNAFYEELWNEIANGRVWKGRIVNRKKDGSLMEEEAIISPIRDTRGGLLGYVGLKRDITGQAAMESRLRQAQRMEAIGTLAGGIAHDFNNILSPMLGYADMLREDAAAGSREQRYLGEICQAGERARELIKQILTFSREAEQERQPIEIAPLVKECLKLLRASIPATIRLEARIDEDAGCALADPAQIHQIVMNLCANAYQAMAASGGTLSVALSRAAIGPSDSPPEVKLPEGEYLLLCVEDTGPGLDEAARERAFLPFYSTKPAGEGSGLGLSIAHGIAASHGGAIAVWSEPGKGARFSVYLPRAAECPAPAEEGGEINIGGEGAGKRVLVVDDEEAIARLAARMLERAGYRAEACDNATAALRMLEDPANRFDALLTDLTMPGLTGLQLAQEALRIRPSLPIVIMTGYSNALEENQRRACGVDFVIQKPIMARPLAAVMRLACQT